MLALKPLTGPQRYSMLKMLIRLFRVFHRRETRMVSPEALAARWDSLATGEGASLSNATAEAGQALRAFEAMSATHTMADWIPVGRTGF